MPVPTEPFHPTAPCVPGFSRLGKSLSQREPPERVKAGAEQHRGPRGPVNDSLTTPSPLRFYRGPRLKGNDRGLRASPQAEIPRARGGGGPCRDPHTASTPPPSTAPGPPPGSPRRYLPWRVPPVRARPPQLLLPSLLPSPSSFPSSPPPAPSSPGRKRPRRFRERRGRESGSQSQGAAPGGFRFRAV